MENMNQILTSYIQDRREREFAGFQSEDLGHLIRQTPANGKGSGWVYFSDIPEEELDHTIQDQITYFETKGLSFEWKVYNFDKPKKLPERLLAHGFVSDEKEHLMVLDLSSHSIQLPTRHDHIVIEQVSGSSSLKSIKRFQESIWNIDLSDNFNYLSENASIFSHYVAMAQGEIIGSGWTEFLEESAFPELHGGAIAPQWRDNGVYSALLTTRLQEIAKRGYQYVTVDAAPMSYPILQKKGFISLATSRPFKLPAID